MITKTILNEGKNKYFTFDEMLTEGMEIPHSSTDTKISQIQVRSFKPEDILSDGKDFAEVTNPYTGKKGLVRKGIVAATLNNVALLNTLLKLKSSQNDIQEINNAIDILISSLESVGVFNLFTLEEWIGSGEQPGRAFVAERYFKEYPEQMTSSLEKKLLYAQKTLVEVKTEDLVDEVLVRTKPFTPEEILRDGENSSDSVNPYTGTKGPARKGIIAATLNNVVSLNSLLSKDLEENTSQIKEIMEAIRDLISSLENVGLFHLFTPEEWISSDMQPGRILAGVLYLQEYPNTITSSIINRLEEVLKTTNCTVLVTEIEKVIKR